MYGIVLTTVMTVISIKILSEIWTTVPIRPIETILIFIPIVCWNVYFCVNSFFVVNYRANEIKSREWIPVFYGYFFDLLFVFWKDLFSNLTMSKKSKKKHRKGNKKADIE